MRERTKDIPALAAHFLTVYAAKMNKQINSIATDAINALMLNDWKGNVRELKNIMERAVILEDSPVLTLKSLPYDIQHEKFGKTDSAQWSIAAMEKQHICKVLSFTGGNKTEAARLLDIGIATLYRKIEEYHLK